MGFWKRDDFYSTKMTSRTKRAWDFGRRRQNGTWGIILISVAAGMLLAAVVFSHGSRELLPPGGVSSGEAAPVMGAIGDNPDDPVIRATERVKSAVVSVLSMQDDASTGRSGTKEAGKVSLGSGVIFSKDGGKAMIVTNNHVVDGGKQIQIVFSEGHRKKASVVGLDAMSDLAVLEVDASGIDKVAQFGDSDQLKDGQTAIAIGNPLGLGASITKGIISSAHQIIPVTVGSSYVEMDVIQTDAAINQGNSGGALINLQGQVIGINSLKIAYMGVEGLGFAIPVNQVKPVIAELIEHGVVKRAYMGIVPENLADYGETGDEWDLPDSISDGVVVVQAVGPAEKAGLKAGDVIVKLDDTAIHSTVELRKYLFERKKIGDSLVVTFYRSGKLRSATLVLEKLPDPK